VATEEAGLPLRVVFSKHARQRMMERKVSLQEVLEALTNPVQLFYDYERDVYLALGPAYVAAVYSMRGQVIEVVTVLRRREYKALVRRLAGRRYKLVF
jgi:hypothetical protein